MKKETREIKTKENKIVVRRFYPEIEQVIVGESVEDCDQQAQKIIDKK